MGNTRLVKMEKQQISDSFRKRMADPGFVITKAAPKDAGSSLSPRAGELPKPRTSPLP